MKQRPARAVLLAEDETILRLLPPLRAAWAPRGEQACVPISGQNAQRTLFGALNVANGRRLLLRRPRSCAVDFQAFLRCLRRQHYRAGQPLWLLLDKATCHTAADSLALAAELDITLLWLPRQCSELNAMDHLWRQLKDDLAANRQRPDIDALAFQAAKCGSSLCPLNKPCAKPDCSQRTAGSDTCARTSVLLLSSLRPVVGMAILADALAAALAAGVDVRRRKHRQNLPIRPPKQLSMKHYPRMAVQAITVLEFLVVVIVVAVLTGLALPVFNSTCIKGPQTKALAQAKQVGLALKLYSGDHNGAFPAGANSYGETIRTSNDAFRSLFPAYTQSETIFGNKLSAWQTSTPDNVITILPDGQTLKSGEQSETLKPGENVYAYVAGLTDAANPNWPLIADGTDGTGYYVTDQKARGGVWKGTKALVIRLDNSGAVEHLRGPDNARFIPRASDDQEHNLLDVASYMGPQAKLLDPATKP
jgi:type II secretory pathway pseudopilin PulG